jgi:catechol 2,3-dioxygenase-like lactoylglutathione lyase family enzyme
MGLAHVGIRVSDLDTARAFYSGLETGSYIPMTHIAIWTEDLNKTREMMISRGLAPTEIRQNQASLDTSGTRRDHYYRCRCKLSNQAGNAN